MCGISGLLSLKTLSGDGTRQAIEVVQRMNHALAPRGPDAEGLLAEAPIVVGHRRLSIIDLTDAGSQPMRLSRTGPVVTYNGEIYNFQELRQSLRSLGHQDWRGNSDTEVVLRVYQQWGLEGLKRLEGIFAIALWDPKNQRLVLMRDRLGVKPLYYGEFDSGLAFASEIKAVLIACGIDATLNEQALTEYLWFGNSHGDRTFYRGVRALEPGQWLIVENNRPKLQFWWRVEEWLERPLVTQDFCDAAEMVRSALDNAVSRQLVADVQVGIFLSGGIDSSAIAASAMHDRSREINSYAVGFDFDRGINELPKAAQVAKHLGLKHHEIVVSSNELESVLIRLAKAHDEPFADAANIPLYLMSNLLQGSIKVVLQGDGGDELFAGYRRYSVVQNANWWRLFPKSLVPYLRDSGSIGWRIARLIQSVGQLDPAIRMALLTTTETHHGAPEELFLPERRDQIMKNTDPFLEYRRAAQRFRSHEPVQQMLLTDLTVQLPSTYLTKVDRATMAAGIEARVPLLDEGLVSLSVGLPSKWKIQGFQKKLILRRSQRGRLPSTILDAPKTGFGVPYGEWLRTSLFNFTCDHLLDSGFLNRFDLNPQLVAQALQSHRAGRENKGLILWKLLQMALWSAHAKSTT